jgi:hypothetical protein
MLFLLKEKPYVNDSQILINCVCGGRAIKTLYFTDIIWKKRISETQHKPTAYTYVTKKSVFRRKCLESEYTKHVAQKHCLLLAKNEVLL